MIVEAITKIAEIASKGIEKLSEASVEIKEKVGNLDKPLNSEKLEDLDNVKEKDYSLSDWDKPLTEKISECDKEGYRPLTEDEMQELRENTNLPDKVEGIQGCKKNDETNVIKYPCRNEALAGTTNPLTGVKYETQVVEINGYKVEVVMPKFDSSFEAQLPEDKIEAKDREQFKECNKQLYDEIQSNSELAKIFTPDQIEQIKDGITNGGAPDGYTWHHDSEIGKMQLIDSDLHADSRHTGGKTLWGGGNENR